MHRLRIVCLLLSVGAACTPSGAPAPILAAGAPARLEIRTVTETSLRVTLRPVDAELPPNPALAIERGEPSIALETVGDPVRRQLGSLVVTVSAAPLRIGVDRASGGRVQELVFDADGSLRFALDGAPVLGLGEGGPRRTEGEPWRQQPVQFDRSGHRHGMEPRWQSDMYGSRNPAPVLLGTTGWGLFVASPWVQVDMTDAELGRLIPVPPEPDAAPQTEGNQQQVLGKGLPPAEAHVPGLVDVFVLDAVEPADAMRDLSRITGAAAMPPKWALGYMQSHRTLQNDRQMVEIVDTFRRRQIPLDAVIYLGTGFAPVGWNERQPSFEFNTAVFERDPERVLAEMHERNVRVVVHMVPWDRDRLPTLHGTIPPAPDETVDAGHIARYWQEHVPLIETGIDGFWPDEGDWFDLHERLKRHQMYYQGSLLTRPDLRPWHLQRNGYPGIARWGGWVWSGDTDSAWKTLEAQIAVGLNYSLSIGPFWGSDIGGFYPNQELTGELYARWFQFGAFCASFRSHGRVWWTRLPWGWGLGEFGPLEYGNDNAPIPADDRRMIRASELGNEAIEMVARRYAELRYRLMPYTYTLAREAHDTGMPLMRAMWLHYPDDPRARGLGTQYLWGRDLLVAPVFEPGATARTVYLPEGRWYDWWTGEAYEGGRDVERPVDLETMPIFVRAGAIVPVDPVRQYTGQEVAEPTTLTVYGGADGEFVLYEDDGISQGYLNGQGTRTRIRWQEAAGRLVLEPAVSGGGDSSPGARTFRVRLLPEGTEEMIRYEGRPLTVEIGGPR